MKIIARALSTALIASLALVGLGTASADAATTPTGALRSIGLLNKAVHAQYNEYGAGHNWNWADSDIVATYRASSTSVGVVRYLGAGGPKIVVDVYDAATREPIGSSRTLTLDPSFDLWGGFHAGSDGHFYVLTGRRNPNQVDAQKVMAVQRFGPTWADEGTGYVLGGANQGIKGITAPFDAGAAAMTLVGQRLVVHTSRTMYKTNDGANHQANFTFEVDTDSMKATPFAELGGAPYSSHSFNQLVTSWEDDLVVVDHGDAYPRAIQMTVMAGYPTTRQTKGVELKALPGGIGDNTTGTSITGIASGPKGVLVVGNAVPLTGTKVDNSQARNVFVIAANPTSGAKSFIQLTSFAGTDDESFAYEPRIAKIADDRFAVIFLQETADGISTEYRLIDSAGSVLASKSFDGVIHSSIDNPTLVGSTLFWVGTAPTTGAEGWLYGLNVGDPAAPFLAGDLRPFPVRPTPTISGDAVVGRTLTATQGSYGVTGVSLKYQWYAGGKQISGATASTFTPTTAQVGKALTVAVRGAKRDYAPYTSTSAPTAAVTDAATQPFPKAPRPKISGTPAVGQTLTADPRDWGTTGVTFAYQWAVGGVNVDGATSRTFVPRPADVGQPVIVYVKASKTGYTTRKQVSVETAPVAP